MCCIIWSEIFFFGCESISYFVSSFCTWSTVHLQYYLQISAFFFYGCDFLINRGCDNHIIITCIILVNYLTIKKPTLVFAFLCPIHVLVVYMYLA